MSSLIIDTATKNLFVGIYGKENKVIQEVGKNHASVLMKKIDELLGDDKLNDIDEIIVGVGPGSYTGVRVGVVVAKMLAWNNKITLKQVSSLFMQSSGYEGIRSVSIDARRGNLFCAIYDSDDTLLLDEALRSSVEFTKAGLDITEDMYKVDLKRVVEKATIVSNPHELVPNYLRKTEAERNKNNED